MTNPQFPDRLGSREVVRPGATASKAGPDMLQRVAALEQGALARPGPDVVNGSVITSDTGSTGGITWKQGPGSYVAGMYAANSGAPTHTSAGGYQKVGSGGGTLTWTSFFDKRPSGASAQVDTATNKRLDVRATGLYRLHGRVSFNSIAAAKSTGCSIYVDGASIGMVSLSSMGVLGSVIHNASGIVSLTAGQYIELFAYQDDSASEAYIVSSPHFCSLQFEYLGPAS